MSNDRRKSVSTIVTEFENLNVTPSVNTAEKTTAYSPWFEDSLVKYHIPTPLSQFKYLSKSDILTNWSHIISPIQSHEHTHAHGSHGPEQVHEHESADFSEAESLTLSDTPLYNPVHKRVLRKQRRDFATLSTPLDRSVVKNVRRQYLESVSKFSR
jgi:hypothetical protein